MVSIQLFTQQITEGPAASDQTSHLLEIIIMLLGAFVLGYLLRLVLTAKYKTQAKQILKKYQALVEKSKDDFGEQRMVSSLETKLAILEQKNNNLRIQLSAAESAKVKLEAANIKTRDLENQIVELQASASAPKSKVVKAKIETEAKAEAKPITKAETKPVTNVTAKPLVSASAAPKAKRDSTNLKLIEGIGPKIQEILNASNIKTFEDVAKSSQENLRTILLAEGPQYKVHDPETWPEQASLARDGKWEELFEWQAKLKGGKKS